MNMGSRHAGHLTRVWVSYQLAAFEANKRGDFHAADAAMDAAEEIEQRLERAGINHRRLLSRETLEDLVK